MNKRNSSNLGDEIRDIVQNAVNTMDFHQLNRDIGNTVNGALDEVRNALGAYPRNRHNWNNPNISYGKQEEHRDSNESRNKQDGYPGQDYSQYGNNERNNNWKKYQQPYSYSAKKNQAETNPLVKKQNDLIPYVPVGRVSGILLTVFGSIGIGIIGIAAFVLCLIGQIAGRLDFFGTIAFGLLPLFFASIYMSTKGSQIRKRLQRFHRYLGTVQGRSYYTIKELSANIGLSKKFVLKDLRKMISIGMFPEGHIDEQETCLILNRESYNQYLELQKNIRMRNFEEQGKSKGEEGQQNVQESAQNSSVDNAMGAELKNAIEGGRECIRQIKEANDAIPGEEISQKLYRLEVVTGKIFNYVELHPAQLPEIQKFMEYYLPTTLKLVNAYKEFDKQPVQGENITTAKKEIEITFDTINLAFEKLFDSLFMNAAMDVSTDISVLETLLAQEGLTQKDFNSNYGRTN